MRAALLLAPLLAAGLAAQTGMARAQDVLPGLYDVTGVAAGDVLNVRQYPGADKDIIGTLAPDAKGIEVVGETESGGWAEIRQGEGQGYVAWRFLVAQDNPPWPELQMPMRCIGTEPFWSLDFDALQQTLSLVVMGEPPLTLGPTSVIRTEGRGNIQGWQVEGADRTGFATLRGETCSDGMSDRAFGLTLDLFLRDASGTRGLTGCCTLDVN